MGEKQSTDLGPPKRSLKLPSLLGDWTTYKPARGQIKRVKSGVYSFDRLSKEEIEVSHYFHYQFSQKLCAALRADLGLYAVAYSIDALQGGYSELVQTLSQPLAESRIILPEAQEDGFLTIDLALVDVLINAAVGSRSLSGPIQHELTEAENCVLKNILLSLQSIYRESLEIILPDPVFEFVSAPNMTALSSIPVNSSFICFSIEIKLDEATGKIIFGFPSKTVKACVKKFMERVGTAPLKLGRLPAALLGQGHHNFSITLGSTSISSKEINSLEAGDVLLLDKSIFSAIRAYLGDKEIALGQPCVKNGKIAFKVVRIEKENVKIPDVKITPPPIEEAEPEIKAETHPEEEFEKEYSEEDYSETGEAEELEEEFEEEGGGEELPENEDDLDEGSALGGEEEEK